jgi:hypothetical protein
MSAANPYVNKIDAIALYRDRIESKRSTLTALIHLLEKHMGSNILSENSMSNNYYTKYVTAEEDTVSEIKHLRNSITTDLLPAIENRITRLRVLQNDWDVANPKTSRKR